MIDYEKMLIQQKTNINHINLYKKNKYQSKIGGGGNKTDVFSLRVKKIFEPIGAITTDKKTHSLPFLCTFGQNLNLTMS